MLGELKAACTDTLRIGVPRAGPRRSASLRRSLESSRPIVEGLPGEHRCKVSVQGGFQLAQHHGSVCGLHGERQQGEGDLEQHIAFAAPGGVEALASRHRAAPDRPRPAAAHHGAHTRNRDAGRAESRPARIPCIGVPRAGPRRSGGTTPRLRLRLANRRGPARGTPMQVPVAGRLSARPHHGSCVGSMVSGRQGEGDLEQHGTVMLGELKAALHGYLASVFPGQALDDRPA